MSIPGMVKTWQSVTAILVLSFLVILTGTMKAHASPGSANTWGISGEVEGMDNINTPGAEGTLLYGGGVTFQYWISPGVGVRIGADYFSNSKSSGPLPQNILPFYSGLMINLISGSMGSLDLVGDFGQVLNNGIDNTYFDAGLQLNSVLSSRRQFFLDVRFREDGVGTMATPWQFVTAGLGINFF
jgi:hypothetical protein|uniref:Outer membrane protein beta-barrel domain-containing protein n=1 Tax=Leptospirillum ferrodiazotrophum TaxID=412449 RepID=C6HWR4_9BACT|nr:MAG: protein of unknown function [Leptospirillum ferrodiazotrophum]